MEDFFNSLYNLTIGFYGEALDNYLFDVSTSYPQIGVFTAAVAFVVSAVYYYAFVPVRQQMMWWWVYSAINAVVAFGISLYYTVTPMVNNMMPEDGEWDTTDCIGFGIANIIWSLVFYFVAALILKWKSTNKLYPFRKF